MTGFHSLLHTLPKPTWDVRAVNPGKAGRRVRRRVASKATGRALRKLFTQPAELRARRLTADS